MSNKLETENSIRRGKLMVWKIPQSTIRNWSRLAKNVPKSEATDCVINSLHLLGVLKNRAFSEAVATKVNAKPQGLNENEILSLIYESINRKEGVYNRNTKTTAGMYEGNISDLKNGEYTFAAFSRRKGPGHVVVIYKNDNKVYVYDPQQEMVCSDKEVFEWIETNDFYRVDFLYYEKTARFRSKTKTKSSTRKKQRTSFDKSAIFVMGTKMESKKGRKMRTRMKKKKKTDTDSLIHEFENLKITD